jgi:beta-N-acetylhexosaminidase
MLLVGFRGLEVDVDHPIVQAVQNHYIGGIVLFDYDVPSQTPVRNIESPAQVRRLVTNLQSFAPIPLLIAIDQEGGQICRLKKETGFLATVSAQDLGRRNDLAVTHEQAAAMARELAQLGINLNLAPVVDLNTNPDNPTIGRRERSFSSNPQVVIDHALEFINAHHRRDVLCTLKHFPGHGSSTQDTHLGLVDVTHTWSAIELEPYAHLIKAGKADAVMTAHVFNAKLDPDYPATLSKATITGLLRQRLNYEGVVISDDIQMRAIADHYGFATAIQATIEAGVDLIAIANNSVYEEDIVGRTVAMIKQAVQAGKISEARIDEAYQRVQSLKHKLGLI